MKFKIVDLFAGVGGFHYGFKQALGDKCEIVLAVEKDKFARQSYHHNFPNTPVHDDVTTLTNIPDCDIVCGGFPCQPFSIAGKRKGLEDTRGTLFYDIARIASVANPSVILLENVKGLVNHDKGRTFFIIKNTFEQLGYTVDWQVLNSRDYGTIQNRERAFLVCHKRNKTFRFPEPAPNIYPLGDILEDSVDDKHTLSNRRWHRLQAYKEKYNKALGLCVNSTTETKTIVARYDNDYAILLYQSYKNPRRLTPRELARLQMFPESWDIVCSMTQSYKQIGNAVTVGVIKHLATEIYNQLLIE